MSVLKPALPFFTEVLCYFEFYANFAIVESSSLEVGGFRGQEPSSVSFVQRGQIRQVAWRKCYRRTFLGHFIGIGSTNIVKQIPPVFLRYIIDEQ